MEEYNLPKEELIQKAKEFIESAKEVQDETIPLEEREKALNLLNEQYHAWYRASIKLFDVSRQGGARKKFESEYQGSFISSKILKFLTSALEENSLYDPNNPLLKNRWLYPYSRCFREPIIKQSNILSELQIDSTMLGNNDWNSTICRILKVFIDKANAATTPQEKGLTYEYLAIFLIGAVEGLSILGHDQRGMSEEIDVWVVNESKDTFWSRHAHDPFIIECKNWGNPAGVQQVRNLMGIMESKNVRFAILMAKNGITGDNYREAKSIIRNAVPKGRYIVVLEHSDLLEIADGKHPTQVIQQKYYELVTS